ncbi:hypothetical protein HC251_25275 (plasmid) [Iamia sp. SCSIO 61187]|uniref:hypothetical protein n=1 Tax=Iamia sp. SCSIO 61187 TaxID=2722752 RepID=UPI001C62A78A|nr:hypothetical protein [Iamia sp. SCSIO 61187]QYG95863.1 hypothetical protein HC251_25275 [Iamia sp. SCSIO 61187]
MAVIALAGCGAGDQPEASSSSSTSTSAPDPTTTTRDETDERIPRAPRPAAAPDRPLSPTDAGVGWVVSALSIDAGEPFAAVEARTATWAVEGPEATVRGESLETVTVAGARAQIVTELADETVVLVTAEVDQAPQLRVYEVHLVRTAPDRWAVAEAEARP